MLRCDDGWNLLASQPAAEDAVFCGTAFTLGNGYLATRGTFPELGDGGQPATFLAGLFEKPRAEHRPPRLVMAPDWLSFDLSDGEGQLLDPDAGLSDYRLALNMRSGTLTRSLRWTGPGGRATRLEVTRLVSLDAPHLCGERFSITPENYSGEIHFTNRIDGGLRPADGEEQHAVFLDRQVPFEGVASAIALGVRVMSSGKEVVVVSRLRPDRPGEACPRAGALAGARHSFPVTAGRTLVLDRLAAYACSRDPARGAPLERATRALARAPAWEELLSRHRQSWQRFWQQSGVEIEGDPASQWMLRFALFHLWQCACDNTRHIDASIGARGIHGPGYNGHVFWDTEIYMLPFFNLTQPQVARALLMYRYRRLRPARRRARLDDGIAGARFPWESADSGAEATPRHSGPDRRGRLTPIRTGDQEIHISADIAYAVWRYVETSGDRAFYLRHGAEIILDTARFWAARLERHKDQHGETRYGISGVIGPDEYHENVANNLFTNAMARWNLRQAVQVGRDLWREHPTDWRRLARKLKIDLDTLEQWEAQAERIRIPFDERRQLYPQFDGFFELEDGRDRCAYRGRWRTADAEKLQIVKQPDVLLALHLLPELGDAACLGRHLDYYEPLTTHESSISPAMHALFAARAGRSAMGLDYLRKAMALDCVNSGDAGSGIHAANLGAIWQAVVHGLAGVSVCAQGISVEPHLPRHWTALSLLAGWRSSQLRLHITHHEVIAALEQGAEPVRLVVEGRAAWVVPGQAHLFPRRAAESALAGQEELALAGE